jgi:hypothetical protein
MVQNSIIHDRESTGQFRYYLNPAFACPASNITTGLKVDLQSSLHPTVMH